MSPRAGDGTVWVGGADIAWHSWTGTGPVMVLVHGGGAHSGWWFDTAEAMGSRHHVIALDLSGHGDSGHRRSYSVATWADEIAAVIREVAPGRVTLVAHSMGGRSASVCAATYPNLVERLVLVDSILPTHESEPVPPASPNRTYRTRAEAVARFRLAPGGGSASSANLTRVAELSVRHAAAGWTWKFDPLVFEMTDACIVNRMLSRISCPVTVVHCEAGQVTNAAQVTDLESALGRSVELLSVAGADHHFMVDNPAAAARVLEGAVMSGRPSRRSGVPRGPHPAPSGP